MKALTGTSLVALAVAALLASLSLVSWRQRQALLTLERVDSLKHECTLERATLDELETRLLQLESWPWVSREAERRLGMRKAGSSDIILLPGADS